MGWRWAAGSKAGSADCPTVNRRNKDQVLSCSPELRPPACCTHTLGGLPGPGGAVGAARRDGDGLGARHASDHVRS